MRAPTPAMRQYLDAKRRHRDAIVFFRMGDFYEMFYEDAVTAADPVDSHFQHMLLQCAIECISHVEGVRETVLSSYQSIDSESKSTDQIHQLLDVY